MDSWFYRTGWTDPFRELVRYQQDLGRLFDTLADTRSREFPPVNLWAGEDGVVVSAELPGVSPEGLKVSVHRNTLTLSGERPAEVPEAGATPLRRERPAGAFSRTVTLPYVVDADKVSARSEGGVLLIHLPRPEADRPRRIQIAAA